MPRRHLQLLTPLLLLAWLLAQNGMALAHLLASWSGHEVVSTWHGGHYDLVTSHDHASADNHPETADSCFSECGHHFDLKPVGPATDTKNKSLLIALLVLLPAVLAAPPAASKRGQLAAAAASQHPSPAHTEHRAPALSLSPA